MQSVVVLNERIMTLVMRIAFGDVPTEIVEKIGEIGGGNLNLKIVYALRIPELDYEVQKCFYLHCVTPRGECFGCLCRLTDGGEIACPPDSMYIDELMDMLAFCAHVELVPIIREEGDRMVVEVGGRVFTGNGGLN